MSERVALVDSRERSITDSTAHRYSIFAVVDDVQMQVAVDHDRYGTYGIEN
jgi:hypothetical protein